MNHLFTNPSLMRDRKLESARQSSSRSKSSAHDIQPLSNVKAFGKHVSPFNAALPRSIGKPLESVRVNIEPADKSGTEMLREKNKPVMNTTLSDSAGNFAMAGIVKGMYCLGTFKAGYYILPRMVAFPAAPLKFLALQPALMQMLKPVVRRVPLHRGAIYPDYDKKSAALLLVLVSDSRLWCQAFARAKNPPYPLQNCFISPALRWFR